MGNLDRKIAIIYASSNFDSTPSLCNAAILLREAGYSIDIYTIANRNYLVPSFKDDEIRIILLRSDNIIPIPFHVIFGSNKELLIGKSKKILIKFLQHIYLFINAFFSWVNLKILSLRLYFWNIKKPYACVIGVEPEGLIMASILSRFTKTPIVYYSLELLLSKEITNPVHTRLKKKELSIIEKSKFIIIQDAERAELLAKDGGIPIEKFLYVPNAPLGSARRNPNNYWHIFFNLPEEYNIVIHSGSINDYTGIIKIVESVRSWPEKWVLVVHTRENSESRWDLNFLREIAPQGKVFFSTKPVPQNDYDKLIDGAKIGIAFYITIPGPVKTQENIRSIGLSSGKIAYYLRSGLPVIVNTDVSIAKLLVNEKCGVAVSENNDISTALSEIIKNYDEYSDNALSFFNRHINVTNNFQKVIEHINQF